MNHLPNTILSHMNSSHTRRATVRPGTTNHGFDDDRGDYKITPGDHLAYRYEVVEILGKGSFGQVIKCVDHKTHQTKAVKVIRNKKRFHQQALIELKLLEHLRHKDADDTHNVVHMEEYFYFRGHLCISFEILSINLYELIKNGSFQGLSSSLVRRFAIQILVTLCFLKKHRIVHCDLKPENILLKHPNKAAIKVIDFGSSCYEEERLYSYIQYVQREPRDLATNPLVKILEFLPKFFQHVYFFFFYLVNIFQTAG